MAPGRKGSPIRTGHVPKPGPIWACAFGFRKEIECVNSLASNFNAAVKIRIREERKTIKRSQLVRLRGPLRVEHGRNHQEIIERSHLSRMGSESGRPRCSFKGRHEESAECAKIRGIKSGGELWQQCETRPLSRPLEETVYGCSEEHFDIVTRSDRE